MADFSIKQALYWSGHLAMNAPGIALTGTRLALASHVQGKPKTPTIFVGTHHKVLTVFLGRVFRVFARITNRSVSQDRGELVDHSCDVLLDTHSTFDFDKLTAWQGLHVVRDPRDLVVSAANYHLRSTESWLHVPREEFGGKTYQEFSRSLKTMEERLLFELDHSAGWNIRDMLDWTYSRPGIVELRYENLVGEGATLEFAKAIEGWSLTSLEKKLLASLFSYFSLGGPGVKGNKHIRNAASGQWRQHFTQRVERRFEELFPGAVQQLGYQ